MNHYDFDRTYHWAVIIGMIIGGIFTLGGIALSITGYRGDIQMLAEGAGLKVQVQNAAPGVVIAVLGMFVTIKLKPRKDETTSTYYSPSGNITQTTHTSSRSEVRGGP